MLSKTDKLQQSHHLLCDG